MIWQFENTEIYILGSIHAMGKEDNCHSNSINETYQKVDRLVFETSLYVTPPSICFYEEDKLSNNISKTLFREVKKEWLKFKLPYEDLEKSKIWQVANSISMNILAKRGFLVQNGIDRNLWDKSNKGKKSIEQLESSETALLCFENSPIEEQKSYLAEVVRNKRMVVDQFNEIVQSWSLGDEERLSSILGICLKKYPVMFKNLIFDRNKLWLSHFLSALQSSKPTLFVVGVLHCVGERRIQNLIRDSYGYVSDIINI